MKKNLCLLVLILFFSISANSQLMISKRIGKNSENSKLGYGTFFYFDFPFRNAENKSIRLEILDAAVFPRKTSTIDNQIGYVSIKLGYKHVFSDTKTGIYIEPQVGYCQTIVSYTNIDRPAYGNAIALALETGYSIEVGQKGSTIDLGLKYENDIASSSDYSVSSIGFRVSYSFRLFNWNSGY